MKKLILIVMLLSLMAVYNSHARWYSQEQIMNQVFDSTELAYAVIIKGTSTFIVVGGSVTAIIPTAQIAELKLVTVEGGTITIKGITTTYEERVSSMVTVGVDISSSTFYKINSRAGRRSILIKNRGIKEIFYRETSLNITTQGNALDGGESMYREDYVGEYYILTEEGESAQNVRIEEVYKP